MAMMTSWVMPVNPSHPYLENDPAPSFAPTICAFHLGFSLVHCRHLPAAAGLPPLVRAGHLCRLCPAPPDTGGVQRVHSTPAGVQPDLELALDFRPLRLGRGPDSGLRRAGRRVQPLFLPPALLPVAGRLRGVLHVCKRRAGQPESTPGILR